ncbi:hypothetical protein CEXT_117051 [Caerostris extrusa]|uniref:Uncharacterized protein n=1 Tax=Caerostris extrusa TaxID=172846 RepID=A0AAV4QIP4_CAEEX|nr:hypothetical protein CEXT_117051 [Caerostris extrusa]
MVSRGENYRPLHRRGCRSGVIRAPYLAWCINWDFKHVCSTDVIYPTIWFDVYFYKTTENFEDLNLWLMSVFYNKGENCRPLHRQGCRSGVIRGPYLA